MSVPCCYQAHLRNRRVYFRQQILEELKPEFQTAIVEAANEAGSWRTAQTLKSEEDYLEKFKGEDVT